MDNTEQQAQSDLDPILSEDQSATSTAMPLLPPDEYRLKVVEIGQERNSKNTGNIIKIRLATMDDVTSISGEHVKAGWPLFANISITPTPDYPRSSIDRALKGFMASAGFPNGSFAPMQRYIGCVVKAKVKVQKANDEWDESNKITRFLE